MSDNQHHAAITSDEMKRVREAITFIFRQGEDGMGCSNYRNVSLFK